ncbi:MAG: monovalent cation:proton antiporter-2 (CPA2) family protein [Gemmatimonadetes bacterium]|nr:monovalent cation:proton antiporter-2 (CPA2) family protein [Gemmatimonadota bacterium]
MTTDAFLAQSVVYLGAAVVAVPVARRLGLGSVLGYLLAGMVIGPFGLGLVGAEGEDVMHFAEFGVVMMLFVIGLELQPSVLWRLRGPILGLGGLQVGLTTAAFTGAALALGVPFAAALAIGMTLALSSTAIVLQTLQEKGLVRTTAGQSAFSVLLFQDIAVIPMLALMPLLAVSGGHSGEAGHASSTWISGLAPGVQVLVVLGAVASVVALGRLVVRPAFRALGRTGLREIFTAAALLLVIGIALLMTRVGLSPALGTFLAGVVLADSEYRHELESDIDPFKGLLLAIFFIAVGASVDFGLVAADPSGIILLTVGIVAVKGLILGILARGFRMGLDQGLLFAFALPGAGEFGFVLFSFAEQEGVLSSGQTAPLVAAVALSMALTPLLLLLNDRVLRPRLGTREVADEREADPIDEQAPVLIAGFGGFGSTVGRFLKANDVATTVLDVDSDRVEMLRQLGLKVYYGDATRHDLLHVAGAAQARMIVLALDTPEKTLAVVRTVQKHFPHLTIFARAFDWPDAHDLVEAGVDHVYRAPLDSAARMGRDALRMLGFRAYQAQRSSSILIRHDDEAMRDLSEMRHDEDYLGEARSRIEAVEKILLAEVRDGGATRDLGWDPDSLREDFGSAPSE